MSIATLARVHAPTRRRLPVARIVLIGFAALVALWLVVPTLIVIPMSFTGASTFQFPPKSWSTQWYANLFEDPTWSSALVSSVVIASLSALAATVLGTAAALGMRQRFPGRSVLTPFLLAPMVVPVVIIAIAIYAVFLPWGLTGTIPGFVAAHCALGLPFVFVTVGAGLERLDPQLSSAAASLGASPSRTFRSVTLPLIAPSMLSGALFAFMASFDEVVVSIFLVTPARRTLPVEMYTSVTRDIDPTVAAAAAVIFVATTILLSVGVVLQARRRTSDA
ncbi:MAG: ABC transporter permease [Solirubrobacteraceae bacterium]